MTKIWAIIITLIIGIISGLKIRGDHYKKKATSIENKLEVKDFQATEILHDKEMDHNLERIGNAIDNDDLVEFDA